MNAGGSEAAGVSDMRLGWRHLGGMGVSAVAAATAAALLGAVIDGPNPAVFSFVFMAALIHVGLFAMPLFQLALTFGWRITLPRVLAAAFLIGLMPISLITGIPAWWAGVFGACGGLAFWRVSGPWEAERAE